MEMFSRRIASETPELDSEGVRMRFIGRREGLESGLVEKIEWAEATTAGNRRITLFVAFNYGGRSEVVTAARRLADDVAAGRLDPASIGAEAFAARLHVPAMPDVDLMVRTSGEQRTSNFLIWQAAYAELVFADCFWPEFSAQRLVESVVEFQRRARRFGSV